MKRSRRVALVATAVIATALLFAPAASAEPSTVARYPSDAATTRLTGMAFDTCNAPTAAAMQAWTASPYDAVGIYIGGVNRTCKQQPNLTAAWVGQVSKMPWRLIPIYLGRQAPCTDRNPPNDLRITRADATAQGAWAARDAIARATALHLRAGSAIYYDMEGYDQTDSSCRGAVLRFLTAWTKVLHDKGYVSGVYANLNRGAKHLSDAYTSTAYARPDAIWIARYDGVTALSNWTLVNGTSIPNSQWASGQRGKQFQGGHNETHGGVTINVDSNQFDGPVATVSFPGTVTTTVNPLSARVGPAYRYAVVRRHQPGAKVYVRCLTPGQQVQASALWAKLNDGSYVPGHYLSTSTAVPACALAYQVKNSAVRRAGPGNQFANVGTLPTGALARVQCQANGQQYSNTRVWSKLHDDTWVTDYKLATAGVTGFSKPLPRCP